MRAGKSCDKLVIIELIALPFGPFFQRPSHISTGRHRNTSGFEFLV